MEHEPIRIKDCQSRRQKLTTASAHEADILAAHGADHWLGNGTKARHSSRGGAITKGGAADSTQRSTEKVGSHSGKVGG